MSTAVRTAVYAIGTALFLASLAFLAIYAERHWSSLQSVQLAAPAWLIASAAIYAASHISTGLSWPLVVRSLDQKMSNIDGLRIGLATQIGKYLPGSVAHYIGRASLAADAGVPIRTSGLSTAVEFMAAPLAAGLISSLMLLLNPTPFSLFRAAIVDGVEAATAVSAVVILALLAAAAWLSSKGGGIRILAGPVACLSVSFLLSGLSFYVLLLAFGLGSTPAPAQIAMFAIAWTIGFFVPGAPAGLGVREAVLVAFLSGDIGASAALAAAAAHRLVTAAVDAAASLVGYAWLALAKRRLHG